LLVQGGGGQYDARRTFESVVLPKLRTGVWHDFVMFVRWDEEHGSVKIWHRLDGKGQWEPRVDLTDVSNIQSDGGRPARNGLRMGLYRDAGGTATNVVYLDGMHRETTFGAAVAGLGSP
jgi:hypothetical protein